MKTYVCAILIGLLGAAITASAYPIRTRPQLGPTHTTHIRHREIRIESVAQINPAYVSAYSPDGYDAVTQAQILASIQALTAQLEQLKQLAKGPVVVPPVVIAPPVKPGDPPIVVVPPVKPADPVVPPAAGPVTALTILRSHCAACHQEGKLLPDQKLTLLDAKGDLAVLTDKQKLKVVQKTRTAQMPPPSNTYSIPSLTDIEFSTVADLMGQ